MMAAADDAAADDADDDDAADDDDNAALDSRTPTTSPLNSLAPAYYKSSTTHATRIK